VLCKQRLSGLCFRVRAKEDLLDLSKDLHYVSNRRWVLNRTYQGKETDPEIMVVLRNNQEFDFWIDERALPVFPIPTYLRTHQKRWIFADFVLLKCILYVYFWINIQYICMLAIRHHTSPILSKPKMSYSKNDLDISNNNVHDSVSCNIFSRNNSTTFSHRWTHRISQYQRLITPNLQWPKWGSRDH